MSVLTACHDLHDDPLALIDDAIFNAYNWCAPSWNCAHIEVVGPHRGITTAAIATASLVICSIQGMPLLRWQQFTKSTGYCIAN